MDGQGPALTVLDTGPVARGRSLTSLQGRPFFVLSRMLVASSVPKALAPAFTKGRPIWKGHRNSNDSELQKMPDDFVGSMADMRWSPGSVYRVTQSSVNKMYGIAPRCGALRQRAVMRMAPAADRAPAKRGDLYLPRASHLHPKPLGLGPEMRGANISIPVSPNCGRLPAIRMDLLDP